ncbi:MAG: hypothetical protein R3C59_30495 [Planctomycetaceae bacterium]
MKRIFLTLAALATILLLTAIVLGLNIGDARSLEPAQQSKISTHMLVGLAALTFATLVHAISLTYFMGTGRWIEETSNAYSLDESFYTQNQKIKYGTLPGLTLCVLLLITTGALGAVADPATPMSLDGTLGMTSAQIHMFGAILTVIVNLITNLTQFMAIAGNMRVVDAVLQNVRRIREERGLPV